MKSQLYQTHEGRLIAFAALKNELCRNPSGREMMERYPNIEKPYNGRYRNYWQKWEFDKAFDDLMTKLEIVPTEEDINIFISGAVFYFNDLSGKRENRGHILFCELSQILQKMVVFPIFSPFQRIYRLSHSSYFYYALLSTLLSICLVHPY